MFGGKARLMLIGSAPVRSGLLEFFARAGFELHQIYGMTETGYLAWNRPGHSRRGSVGQATYPGTLLIGEDGEVLIKHPWHICCGYEGEAAEDASSVFRGDDVIATGDLGYFQGEYLYLKGRKKNVIITAGGRKLAVDELEDELAGTTGVNRVALIDAPDERGLALVAWFQGDRAHVRAELRSRIENVSRRLGVGSEIHHLALVAGELAPDSPLLNRNLKLNRAAVRAAVADQLEEIG
jgi:long-chain acyl-CoA synthetase